MNKITICGRLTRDPETRTTSTGNQMVTMGVAVNRRRKPDGQQEADFFDVMAFGKQAELCAQYLQKGRQVLITGRMEASRYEKDGQKRTYWNLMLDEVEFIGSKNDSATPSEYGSYPQRNASSTHNSAPANYAHEEFTEVPDDDLPF